MRFFRDEPKVSAGDLGIMFIGLTMVLLNSTPGADHYGGARRVRRAAGVRAVASQDGRAGFGCVAAGGRSFKGEIRAIIEVMATVRITEAELARDIHAVLTKVRQGVEVIVEQDNRAVAVIRPPHRSGRPVSEILRQAREHNSAVTLDPEFGKDLEAIIASHQEPWNPPSWE